VIVDEAVAADLESRLVARALTIEVGSTSDPSVQMGPLIDTDQVDVVDGFVRRAVREGASIACGGIRLERPGHFYAPTILTGVSPDMEVAREEVFGPVLSVIRVRSASEALDVLNDTPYGLSASIHTTSLATAEMFVSGTDAGVTSVNGPTSGIELPAPFGGFKLSGTSYKEHGPEALDFYTRIKLVRWTA
jgi:aldehyde dehydrogenase (NAD+)